MLSTFRDLTLVPVGLGEMLVVACDSLGGIGPKSGDMVKTSSEIVGQYTVRVPLMEVLAAGAKPFLVINTLSVEMEPTGRGILAGIEAEIKMSGLESILVTGSTEENIPTCQTGVGITVIGRAPETALRLGRACAGDTVFCIGRPKVGDEVLDGEPTADIPLLRKLLDLPWVREILPVGSKGVSYEAHLLAIGVGCVLTLSRDSELDLHKSAGPATCVLVAADPGKAEELAAVSCLPVYVVGTLA